MTKLTANDVENITNVIFPSWQKACLNFLEEEKDILARGKVFFEKVTEIKKKYQLNINENFNIFTAIAEKYRYENLHSDLLKVILGNEKNNIGNPEIFSKFLQYIGISEEDRNKYFSDYDSVKFEREYPIAIPLKDEKDKCDSGRIDLLIYTDDACIIIENKINGAPDQPNQLGKYYMQMKINEQKKVLKIVYLTINKSDGPSNFEDYTSPYTEHKSEIGNLLKPLPCVIEQTGKSARTFTKFLGDIIVDKSIEHDNTKKVFIEQYKLLIESIGGQVLMSEPEEDLISYIMESQKKIHTANNFAENFKGIWERRAGIIGKVLVRDWRDIDNIMTPKSLNGEKDVCAKSINNKVGVYYTYNDYKSNNNIEFGFCSLEGQVFEEPLEEELKKILKSLESSFTFTEKGEDWDKKWVYAHVHDLGDFTYNEIKTGLKNCLKILEKEATEILNKK